MAEKKGLDEIVEIEEIVISDMITLEAVIKLLVEKGIITNQELVDSIMAIRTEILEAEKK